MDQATDILQRRLGRKPYRNYKDPQGWLFKFLGNFLTYQFPNIELITLTDTFLSYKR
jgi:hypothetical protein